MKTESRERRERAKKEEGKKKRKDLSIFYKQLLKA